MLKSFKQHILESQSYNNLLSKLIDLIWERFKPEMKDFLDKISSQDADIKRIYEELENFTNQEPDVISKNASDSNFGNGEI